MIAQETFEHVEPEWVSEIRRYANAAECGLLLVGNKSDMTDQRVVSETEAQVNKCRSRFFDSVGCRHSLTSLNVRSFTRARRAARMLTPRPWRS